MNVKTISVLLLLISIYYIISVGTEFFLDDYIHPSSMFSFLLISSTISSIACLIVDLDIPE